MKSAAKIAIAGILVGALITTLQLTIGQNHENWRRPSFVALMNSLPWFKLLVHDGALLYFLYALIASQQVRKGDS